MGEVPHHLEIMRDMIGVYEFPGAADNPVIVGWAVEIGERVPITRNYVRAYQHDSTAWCGLAQAICMVRAGIMPPFGDDDLERFLWARSWATWGTAVRGRPQLGDVLVLDRHVTMFDGVDSAGNYIGLGGNQSDKVKRSIYAPDDVRDIRRPPAPTLASVAVEAGWSRGRGSWYSQFVGRYRWIDNADAPGSAALEVPDDAQGIALYDRSTLGQWLEVRSPNGVTSYEQHTDIGPHPRTGRTIDVSAAAAERFGYSPSDFPTDDVFTWRRVDPPRVVAHLAPRQQATAYRDLRKGTDMADDDKQLPATIPPAGAPQQHASIDWLRVEEIARGLAERQVAAKVAEFAHGMAERQRQPGSNSAGLALGLLGLLGSIVGVHSGVTAPPIGTTSTMTGSLLPAASGAIAILGALGGVSPTLGLIGRVLGGVGRLLGGARQ